MPTGKRRILVDPRDWLINFIWAAINDAPGWITIGLQNSEYVTGGNAWHHPSGLANRCLRAKQFAFIGMPSTDDSWGGKGTYAAFLGTASHKLFAHLVSNTDPIMDEFRAKYAEPLARIHSAEVTINEPNVPVLGTFDVDVIDYDDVDTVVDWKTVGNLPRDLKEDHAEQILWYMYMKGRKRGSLMYISRINGDHKRFDVDWATYRPLWEQSAAEAEKVTIATVNGVLADRTPPSRTDCPKCPFYTVCERTENSGDESWRPLALAAVEELMAR